MSYYFCLCPGGIKSEKDADVRVESFREIQQIINDFGNVIPNKFTKLRTQHIMDESPVKFPHWGKVYMVLGTTKDGHEVPLGYCNFEKKWHNSFSAYSFSLYFLFALSCLMAIHAVCIQQFSTSLWCITSAMLVICLLMHRQMLIRLKMLFLLK